MQVYSKKFNISKVANESIKCTVKNSALVSVDVKVNQTSDFFISDPGADQKPGLQSPPGELSIDTVGSSPPSLYLPEAFPRVDGKLIRNVFGEWLDSKGDEVGGWQWYVTTTYRDLHETSPYWSKPGWSWTDRAWQQMINEIGYRKGMGTLFWCRGREYHKARGVSHFHGLIAGVGDVRRMDIVEWHWKKFGMARIYEYDRSLGAQFYIPKYVLKELGEFVFSQSFTRGGTTQNAACRR